MVKLDDTSKVYFWRMLREDIPIEKIANGFKLNVKYAKAKAKELEAIDSEEDIPPTLQPGPEFRDYGAEISLLRELCRERPPLTQRQMAERLSTELKRNVAASRVCTLLKEIGYHKEL